MMITDPPEWLTCVTRPDLYAGWVQAHLTNYQRRRLCELIRAYGFEPSITRSVAYDVIDTPLLRIETYLRDEHGQLYLSCKGQPEHCHDGCHAATETHEIALRTPLPEWWQPELEKQ